MATANEVLKEAKDFKRCIDKGFSIEDVSKKARPRRTAQYVRTSLKLLKAPTEVHDAIPVIGKDRARRIACHYHGEPDLQKLLAKLAIEGKKEKGEHRPKRDLVKAALYEKTERYGEGRFAKKRAEVILRKMLESRTPGQPVADHKRKEDRRGPRLKPPSAIPRHGSSRENFGPEGEEHLRLKQYVKDNPSCVGINRRILKSEMERPLPSGDKMDVFFKTRDCWIGVEVKSWISDVNDIERGLYQCVKYRAVMEKHLAVRRLRKNVKVFLVLGHSFPRELRRVKKILDVKVIENIGVHDGKDGMPPLPED